jgi:adenylyltransferase/sulfurtransferase
MKQLTNREIKRYEKHIMLPEIGMEGQIKIGNASVAVVGAGGLGCPVLQYLAAAGVGRIGIVEYDMVDESNLQRQILYGSADRGKLKSIISRDRLNIMNDLVEITIYKYEGQVSVFNHMNGPSYRCYNPEQDIEKSDPAPAETGLLGVLPGITGTYMATEVLKIITGIGEVLSGRVLIFNILKNSSYTIEITRNPDNFLL